MALALVNDPCISILICIVGLIISIHVLLLMITRVCYEAQLMKVLGRRYNGYGESQSA